MGRCKELSNKLNSIYPFLSEEESIEIIKYYTIYLEFIIDNLENT